MPLWHTFVILCIVLTSVSVLQAEDVTPYSFQNIAGFAHWLVQQKEFYRANQEFNRLYHYYPTEYPYVNFLAASLYCKYEGKQFQSILNETENSESKKYWWVWVFRFDSALGLNHYLLSEIASQPASGFTGDEEIIIAKRKCAYLLLRGASCNELSPYMKLVDNYDLDRIYEYTTFTRSKLRNEYAALGWGVIPGAGYIYSGNTENGIIAAIVIGVCVAATYLAYDTGNSVIALFTGTVGTFFYGGSVLGGYLAAKKTNQRVYAELQSYYEESLQFSQDRELIYNRYGKPKTQ